jgi:K+-transporting ATPase ATPase A chain
MDASSWWSVAQYAVFIAVVTALVKPVGGYMARVFQRQPVFLDFALGPVERLIYKATRVDAAREMTWREYAVSFVVFSVAGTLLLFLILRSQTILPFFAVTNEFLVTPMTPDLAMNTAISFSTTTTWQAYGGERTMTYFSQVVGLTVQNFLAAAGGLAVGVAFIRAFVRERSDTIGNFWVDLTRSILWILLPLSLIGSTLLVWQGVPVNFQAYTQASTLDGASQTIAQGPVALLEFIKNLGTNGGGFFNVNAAHPFENPTPFTNFLEMLAIVILPAGFTYTFGKMIGRQRHGWLLFGVMTALFVAGIFFAHWSEQRGNPQIAHVVNQTDMPNLEGKETRFGVGGSVLAAITTSNGATGSYNSVHDSYTPLGGLVPLANMLLGEIVYGGLGTGLYSIILVALIALFLCGLMIGRKPEYLGKEIGVFEIKMIMLYVLAAPLFILVPTALAVTSAAGLAGLTTNDGAHGYTEILFAYTSSFANNGQTFAGLSTNSAFYNITTSVVMMAGRFALAVPALALAGSLAAQGRRPVHIGTVPTDSVSFGFMLIMTALIVGALSYFPALALGPILEHLTLANGPQGI